MLILVNYMYTTHISHYYCCSLILVTNMKILINNTDNVDINDTVTVHISH